MKLTKRKGFNFFRSYYDVYNELNDKDKLAFIDALLDRQFLGIKPEGLKGMAMFAYISQTNSIDSQVKGYETKTNTILLDSSESKGAKVGARHGGTAPPTLQVEGEEEEEEEVQSVALIEDKHREFSIKFYKELNERGIISKKINGNTKSLIDHIRKLETVDKIKWEDITNGANYYFNNLNADYLPEIQGTKSFRDKFDKLVAHKKRQP